MCRNWRASLVTSILAWALIDGAYAQPPPDAPPKVTPSVHREELEASLRKFQEMDRNNQEAKEKIQELEAERSKMIQEGIDRVYSDKQRDAEEKRRKATHNVVDAVFVFAVALATAIFAAWMLWKRPKPDPTKTAG